MQLRMKVEGTRTVKAQLDKMPRTLYPKVKRLFQGAISELQSIMVKRTSGAPLKRRSGELARGFKTKVGGSSLNTLFGEVINSVRYVAIHEFGGTIKAVKAKYLTIPLPKNQTATGRTKKTARQLFSSGNAFIAKGVIFENRGKTKGGKDRKPVPMFALKKSVQLKAQLGFREAAAKIAKKLYREISRIL